MRRMSDSGPAGQPPPGSSVESCDESWHNHYNGTFFPDCPAVSRPPPSLTYFNSAASVMSWARWHLPPWRHLDLRWDCWISKLLKAHRKGCSWDFQDNVEWSGGQHLITLREWENQQNLDLCLVDFMIIFSSATTQKISRRHFRHSILSSLHTAPLVWLYSGAGSRPGDPHWSLSSAGGGNHTG